MSISSRARISPEGLLDNGVQAAAVVQLIVDYDEAPQIEDVANYFKITVEDVSAALDYCSRHFERLQAAGCLIR